MSNINQPIPDSRLEEEDVEYFSPFKEEDDNAWSEEWFEEESDE